MKNMKKEFLKSLLAGAILVSTQASALSVVGGDFVWKLENFEQFIPGIGSDNDDHLPGVPSGAYNDGVEDLRGVFNITQISWSDGSQNNFNTMSIDGINNGAGSTTGESLVGVFYGFDLNYQIGNPFTGASDFGYTGGHVDLWLDATPDEDVTVGVAGYGGTSADYATITDGDAILWLSLDFVPSSAPLNPLATTLFGTNNPVIARVGGPLSAPVLVVGGACAVGVALPGAVDGDNCFAIDGNGFGSMVATGGAALDNFPTAMALGNHFGSEGNANFFTHNAFDWGWNIASEDPVTGVAVPEPGTLALLGLGLLGFGVARRSKAQ